MKHIILIIVLVATLTLNGCGWSRNCTNSRSYKLGEDISVAVGYPLIQSGCFDALYIPRGFNSIIREPIKDDHYVPNIEKELIYSGREGGTLHILYNQYPFNWTYDQVSSQASSLHIYYDLSASNSIVFQDWTIDVLESNNKQIKFKVIKEPSRGEPFFLYNPKNRYQ